jgi:hypothetical protein
MVQKWSKNCHVKSLNLSLREAAIRGGTILHFFVFLGAETTT